MKNTTSKEEKKIFEAKKCFSVVFYAVLETWHDDCFCDIVRSEGFRFRGKKRRPRRRMAANDAAILPDCGYSKHLVMAEWSKAADCKSVRSNPHIGSNPVHESNINKKEV